MTRKPTLYDKELFVSSKIKKFKMIVRTVMCANLFLERPQKISKMKRVGIDFKLNSYPENILVSNLELRVMQADPKLYFEKCMKSENLSLRVVEVFQAVFDTVIIQIENGEVLQAIRLNRSTDFVWFQKVFFSSEKLVFELLKSFLSKIHFHLENKTLFMSGYTAGRVLISICKNMYLYSHLETSSHLTTTLSQIS